MEQANICESSEGIYVISDMHLGYEKCNKKELNQFIEHTKVDKNRPRWLVVNGDGVDFLRRDDRGVLIENADTMHKFLELDNLPDLDIYWVCGNHDLGLRNLDRNIYQLKFTEHLSIENNGIKYRFMHGHQFDPTQVPFLLETLGNMTGDSLGKKASYTWRDMKETKRVFEQLLMRTLYRSQYETMLKSPEERGIKDLVEQNAFKWIEKNLGPEDWLCIGHTHEERVLKGERYANSGCWVGEKSTYLNIRKGNIKVEKF